MQAMTDYLCSSFPQLGERLPKLRLANLPTPLREASLQLPGGREQPILVKCDDLSGDVYGGNKVRKLEYVLARAHARGAERVATFGAVASNHALATTLYASAEGLGCTCFLTHQARTPRAPVALNLHQLFGTEIIRFGGSRAERVATLRGHLAGRKTWVIPMGGSSWLGTVGFVNAGLELAAQLDAQGLAVPARVYVANGTMGTAAGLCLGLALAGLRTEVHAVRVTDETLSSPAALQRLITKTAALMHALDPAFPADIAAAIRLKFRDEFFAGGYARSNAATDAAVAIAQDQLGLTLESTYTGKAMAALLADARDSLAADETVLFWNTYNSRPLPEVPAEPLDPTRLPEEFLRYFD